MPTIHSPRLTRSAGVARAEVSIDEQVLWFEGPEQALLGNLADAALSACLVPAIRPPTQEAWARQETPIESQTDLRFINVQVSSKSR